MWTAFARRGARVAANGGRVLGTARGGGQWLAAASTRPGAAVALRAGVFVAPAQRVAHDRTLWTRTAPLAAGKGKGKGNEVSPEVQRVRDYRDRVLSLLPDRVRAAVHVFAEMERETGRVYNTRLVTALVHGLLTHKHVDAALQLLRRFPAEHPHLKVHPVEGRWAYDVMKLFVTHTAPTQQLAAFHILADDLKIPLSLVNYTNLLKKLIKTNSRDMRFVVMMEYWKHLRTHHTPDVYACNEMLRYLVYRGHLKLADVLLLEMDAAGLEPSKQTHELLLQLCAKGGDLDGVVAAERALSPHGRRGLHIVRRLVRAYAECGDVERCESRLRELLQRSGALDEHLVGSLMRAYARAGDKKKLVMLMDQVRGQSEELHGRLFTEFLEQCAAQGWAGEAKEYFATNGPPLAEANGHLYGRIATRMMRVLSNEGDFDGVQELYQSVMKEHKEHKNRAVVVMMDTIIAKHAKAGNEAAGLREATDLFENVFLQKVGNRGAVLSLRPKALQTYIRDCARQGNLDAVRLVMHRASNVMRAGVQSAYLSLCDGLASGGRSDELVPMLEHCIDRGLAAPIGSTSSRIMQSLMRHNMPHVTGELIDMLQRRELIAHVPVRAVRRYVEESMEALIGKGDVLTASAVMDATVRASPGAYSPAMDALLVQGHATRGELAKANHHVAALRKWYSMNKSSDVWGKWLSLCDQMLQSSETAPLLGELNPPDDTQHNNPFFLNTPVTYEAEEDDIVVAVKE